MLGWIKNIGLSWKVQLAPTFLILVLIGVGAYALQALRSNQTAVAALVVRSGAAIGIDDRTQHRRVDRACQAVPARGHCRQRNRRKESSGVRQGSFRRRREDFGRPEGAGGGPGRHPKPDGLAKLKTAVAGYLKQSKNAIEMADGDAGSALLFIKGAERNFADIEKLTDDLIARSSESKDLEIARAGIKLEQQQLTLMAVLVVVAFAGIVVSFLIGRNISRPVVAMSKAMRELAVGNFDVQLPGLDRRDEVGQMGSRDTGIQGAGHRQGRTRDRRARGQEPRTGGCPARRTA